MGSLNVNVGVVPLYNMNPPVPLFSAAPLGEQAPPTIGSVMPLDRTRENLHGPVQQKKQCPAAGISMERPLRNAAEADIIKKSIKCVRYDARGPHIRSGPYESEVWNEQQ